MSYSVQNIRNVCLLGHSGSGKTSLAESLLFMTGAIDRMGRVADGNTVCDYDPEEVKRQISLSTAVAPIDYKGCRINVLDTPGAFDFSGEVMEALRAADAAIIVASAKDGVSVGVEKAWKYCEERNYFCGVPQKSFFLKKSLLVPDSAKKYREAGKKSASRYFILSSVNIGRSSRSSAAPAGSTAAKTPSGTRG